MSVHLKKKRSKPAEKSKLVYKPKKHHKKGIEFLLKRWKHGGAGILAAPGAGKTSMFYAAFMELRKKGARRALVISKTRAIYGPWPKELEKWGFPLKLVYLHGKDKFNNLTEDGDVYITNYESLLQLGKKLPKFLTQMGVDVLCLDESTKIKNPGSKRFRILKTVLELFKFRVIMTGSPRPRSYEDLWSQIYVIDLGETLGERQQQFMLNYFLPCGYKGKEWRLAEGAEEEIASLIKPMVMTIETEQLDLPPLHHVERPVQLPPSVMKQYREMEREFILEIEQKGVIVACTAGAASMKLRQIASGSVYDDRKRVIHLHDEKLDELEELVEELGDEPLLVGCMFKHEVPRILNRFPQAVSYDSGVSWERGAKIEDDWNKGRIPILVGNPASIGHALNLQEYGCHVAFFSSTFNFEDWDQFIRRIYRTGQKRPVTVHHLIAHGTIDSKLMEVMTQRDVDQKRLWTMIRSEYAKK